MSDDLDDLEMISGRVPKWQAEAVKADPRDNQEVLRVALLSEFGGKRDSFLDAKKKQHENAINSIEESLKEMQEALKKERSELEKVQQQKENVETFEEKRVAAIDDFIDRMIELGATPPRDHKEIESLAETWFDANTSDAVEAILERCEERDTRRVVQ